MKAGREAARWVWGTLAVAGVILAGGATGYALGLPILAVLRFFGAAG